MNASATIFPKGSQQVHHDIFVRSLNALSRNLHRNMHNLVDFGPIGRDFRLEPDPLAPIQYSCVFWLVYLCEFDSQTLEYS